MPVPPLKMSPKRDDAVERLGNIVARRLDQPTLAESLDGKLKFVRRLGATDLDP